MPKLSEIYKTKSITLPVSGIKVEIYTLLSVENDQAIMDIKDEQEQSIETVLRAIKSWDFEDENGQVLPITKENVVKIPNFDGRHVMKEFGNALASSNPENKKEEEKPSDPPAPAENADTDTFKE